VCVRVRNHKKEKEEKMNLSDEVMQGVHEELQQLTNTNEVAIGSLLRTQINENYGALLEYATMYVGAAVTIIYQENDYYWRKETN
jgi:hypothetical protein